MLIKTYFNSKIKFIIINDQESLIYGNGLIKLNIGNNILNIGNINKFYSSPKIYKTIPDKYLKSKGYNSFTDLGLYVINGDCIICLDIIIFFYYSLKQNTLFSKFKKIGFLFKNKLYIFNKNNIDNVCYFFSHNLGNISYDIIRKIGYSNKTLFLTNKFKLKKYLKQINTLISNNNIYKLKKGSYQIIDKESSQDYIFKFYWERVKKDNFPKSFNDPNYCKGLIKDIKIDTGEFKPISQILKCSTIFTTKKIGFAAGTRYMLNDPEIFLCQDKQNYSAGYSLHDSKTAKNKAFAEGIERYCSGFFPSDNKNKKTIHELNIDICQKIIGFPIKIKTNQKFHYKDIYNITVEENKIIRKEKVINIPYNLVYYPIINKDSFYNTNSNGIAAGRSYEEAIIGGLMELSERDSIMSTWIHKLTPPIITNLPINLQYIIKTIEKDTNGKIFVFDISYDKSFPHILIINKYKDNNKNKYNIGAACGLNLEDTIYKSLNEILLTTYYLKENTRIIKDFKDIKNISDHSDFYNNSNNIDFLYFLFNKNQTISFNEIFSINNSKITDCLDILIKKVGGKYYVADLTTIYSKKLGIYVCKIFSENLIPIWFGHGSILPSTKKRYKVSKSFNKYQIHNYKYNIPDFLHFFD